MVISGSFLSVIAGPADAGPVGALKGPFKLSLSERS
jgi:hypothetical protein